MIADLSRYILTAVLAFAAGFTVRDVLGVTRRCGTLDHTRLSRGRR